VLSMIALLDIRLSVMEALWKHPTDYTIGYSYTPALQK